MRILQLIDHLGCGGAQVVLSDILAHWPLSSDTVQVISLGRKNPLASRFREQLGVDVHCLGLGKWDFSALRRVRDAIHQGRYDIVHAHLDKATAAALLPGYFPSPRLVIHLHSDPTRQPVLRAALRCRGHRASGVIAVSKHTAAVARRLRLAPADRLRTMPNGVSLPRLDDRIVRPEETDELRDQWSIPREAFLLGFVGRLARHKGISYLLQALQSLDRQTMLVLLGDGPLANALRRETRWRAVSDRVRFVGFQTDIVPWLHSCDALVLPSLTEGLPITVLEACALRRPVIATRVGGVEELLTDGETGLLVPPRDVPALRRAITRLRDSRALCGQLAEAARQHVEQHFSAERLAVQVREFFCQVVEPSPARRDIDVPQPFTAG